MADGFDEEDIFSVFDQASPAATSTKRKSENEDSTKPSSTSQKPQVGEKKRFERGFKRSFAV